MKKFILCLTFSTTLFALGIPSNAFEEKYTPTRAEWIATVLNSGVNPMDDSFYKILYIPKGKNLIVLNVYFTDNTNLNTLNEHLRFNKGLSEHLEKNDIGILVKEHYISLENKPVEVGYKK